jgi:hypothetical protein
MNTKKPSRLAAIEALPGEMQEHALVDWPTVAVICNFKDIGYARNTIKKAGIPLVCVSERRKLPTWGTLRAWLQSREAAAV